MPMKRIVHFVLPLLTWAILGTRASHAETFVPEFYGVYLVSDGTPQELSKLQPTYVARTVGLKDVPPAHAKSDDFYVVVYLKDYNPEAMQFAKLKFLRRAVAPLSAIEKMSGERQKVVDYNAWVMEKAIPIRIAPIQDKRDMYKLVPKDKLEPGVYAMPAAAFAPPDAFSSGLEGGMTLSLLGGPYGFTFKFDQQSTNTDTGSPNTESPSPGKIEVKSWEDFAKLGYWSDFPETVRDFDLTYDKMWTVILSVLRQQGENIAIANKETGLFATNVTKHGFFLTDSWDRYYISLSADPSNKTHIRFKVLTFSQQGQNPFPPGSPKKVRAFLEGIDKTIASMKDQGFVDSINVNGHELKGNQDKWVRYVGMKVLPTIPKAQTNRYRIAAVATWWGLKEGTFSLDNPHGYSNCSKVQKDGKPKNVRLGPLDVCEDGRPWQVGLAAVQVPNFSDDEVAAIVKDIFPSRELSDVLKEAAELAGFISTKDVGRSILTSSGALRRSWLIRHPSIGLSAVFRNVQAECVEGNQSWCYGSCPNTWKECQDYASSKDDGMKSIADLESTLRVLDESR